MSTHFRETQFDVALVAGPRLELWPTVGTKIISQICSKAGLKVGLFGGQDLQVLGVLPVPSTGGFVVVQDVQGRIHRISARAVVKVAPFPQLPDPFIGWNTEGLIPYATASRLFDGSYMEWLPGVAILGTGNEAVRFGSKLLEKFQPLGLEVYCIESVFKSVLAWEVEKRYFETMGGKFLFAEPKSLTPRGAMRWEFRIRDTLGIRVLEVGRVVSVGPFSALPGVKEYPADSNLYELEHTAHRQKKEQVEGWQRESHYASGLALKIIRALGVGDHIDREQVEVIQKQVKRRLKQNAKYRESKIELKFDGKWIQPTVWSQLSAFDGVPKNKSKMPAMGPLPSIECFEDIPCQECALNCPEGAIKIDFESRAANKILSEDLCTGCGICLSVCPSSSIVSSYSFVKGVPQVPFIVGEGETEKMESIRNNYGDKTFLWLISSLQYQWKLGETVHLLNRRGDVLGTGRIHEWKDADLDRKSKKIKLEVPVHLIWDARGIRPKLSDAAEDRSFLSQNEALKDWPKWVENRVEVTLNGSRRFMRDGVPASVAFFETGQARSDDVLLCSDQSCGLCTLKMDGVKKLACASSVHQGMVIQTKEPSHYQLNLGGSRELDTALSNELELNLVQHCPCLEKTWSEMREQVKDGMLKTVEAALERTRIGEGSCHGQRCLEVFRRLLISVGIDAESWIDWKFPWRNWNLS